MNQAENLMELVKSEQIHSKAIWEDEATRFLRFSLGKEIIGLLSLDRLVEVLKVRPSEILPIPQVPNYLLGIANRRGEAVWMVDLSYLMGAIHLSQREIIPEICTAILVQAQEQAIGLLVEQVYSIEVYNLSNLQPFPAQSLPSTLLSFLEGYFVDSEGKTLTLLDVDTIIETVENLNRVI